MSSIATTNETSYLEHCMFPDVFLTSFANLTREEDLYRILNIVRFLKFLLFFSILPLCILVSTIRRVWKIPHSHIIIKKLEVLASNSPPRLTQLVTGNKKKSFTVSTQLLSWLWHTTRRMSFKTWKDIGSKRTLVAVQNICEDHHCFDVNKFFWRALLLSSYLLLKQNSKTLRFLRTAYRIKYPVSYIIFT